MSEEEKDQWYTNKDLFEQIMGLQQDMKETRSVIKKYNGLYEKVNYLKVRIDKVESRRLSKMDFVNSIRQWGGWIFALITLIFLVIKTFN